MRGHRHSRPQRRPLRTTRVLAANVRAPYLLVPCCRRGSSCRTGVRRTVRPCVDRRVRRADATVAGALVGGCVSDRALPETRFARTPGGSSIAYHCVGDGDLTIVSVPPMAQNIEMAWEWPAIRRMFEGFATFCRFLPFDKRGTGMSNRSLDIPRLDERVDELSAVLDHAGLDHTYLMGTSEGGPMTR